MALRPLLVAFALLIAVVAGLACNTERPTQPGRTAEANAGAPSTTLAAPPDAGGVAATVKTRPECRELAVAFCAHLADCSRADLALRYLDLTTCLRVVAATCDEASGLPGALPPGPGCAPAIAEAACAQLFDPVGTIPACSPRGTGARGAACSLARQCASGICIVEGEGCGRCAGPYGEGMPCDERSACPSGLVCRGECVVEGLPHHPCDTSRDCVDGLFCAGGVCSPRVADGERCDSADACALGHRCADGRCAPLGVSPRDACATASDCAFPADCFGGRCREAEEGEPCSGSCASPLVCLRGACAKPQAAGAPCAPDEHACGPGLTCAAGSCRGFVAVGPGERCDRATLLCAGAAVLGELSIDQARDACRRGVCPSAGSPCESDAECALVGGACVEGRCGAPARCGVSAAGSGAR